MSDLQTQYEETHELLVQALAENEQLRRKVELLEEDAERYRWCLSHPMFASVYFHEQSYDFLVLATKRIDAAREAAREKKRPL